MALPISVLDLSPVASGSSASEALENTIDLAQRAESLGYARYWLAEHHNMPGIASAAPEILIGQVARVTDRMRVGSGGIMLPNHAPLKVAEWFLTLEALFPGRIDLGIGRAAGTDPRTALALRGSNPASGDDLPLMLDELTAFATGGFPTGHPMRNVRAMPYGAPLPPVWLLGSSDFSARLAAARGLGFVFAHHINAQGAAEAMRLYRRHFKPSDHMSEPKAILATSIICADTDDYAEELASSVDLVILLLHRGERILIPSPAEARAYQYSPFERDQIRFNRDRMIVGCPNTIRAELTDLIEKTQADELMVTTMTHSHTDRVRSYELLAGIFTENRQGASRETRHAVAAG